MLLPYRPLGGGISVALDVFDKNYLAPPEPSGRAEATRRRGRRSLRYNIHIASLRDADIRCISPGYRYYAPTGAYLINIIYFVTPIKTQRFIYHKVSYVFDVLQRLFSHKHDVVREIEVAAHFAVLYRVL